MGVLLRGRVIMALPFVWPFEITLYLIGILRKTSIFTGYSFRLLTPPKRCENKAPQKISKACFVLYSLE
jgi:hypothetical protein